MARTPEERAVWEQQCFGCAQADLQHALEQAFSLPNGNKEPMLAMSILSDAQHVIEHGNAEYGRQLINRAKWLISTHWFKQEEQRG